MPVTKTCCYCGEEFKCAPYVAKKRKGCGCWQKMNLHERVRFHVDASAGPDACWPWTAGKANGGYGAIRYNGSIYRAHRIAWTIANGAIPQGMLVLHKCDNPPCCNPAHLFIGTHKDNSQDMARKGRTRGPWSKAR